jgi:hypothetical protein
VAVWLGRHGAHDVDIEVIEAVLAEVKARSLEKKALLDDDEFVAIVDKVSPGLIG